jgi:thioester reductase-like protein
MTVLLTGATGFLGRHILWDLLRRDPEVEVHCLLRPTRRASPARRLDQLVGPVGGDLTTEQRARCHPVTGDVTDEALFEDPALAARLADEVDRVIHCAATVTFDSPLAEARDINVDGTRNVLRFGEKLHTSGRLRRFDHFSTAYVAGRADGVVRDDELITTTFNNTYEQTKWESEELVRELQRELPITIFRPSIIVGDSRTGRTTNFRVLYWPLKVLSTGLAWVVPLDAQGIVDLVPIDYVVEAFHELSRDDSSLGKCFHLAAGPDGQSTCGELLDAATKFFGVRRPWLISPRVSYRIVRPFLYAVIWGRRRPLLRTAEQFFPYFAYRATFDTTTVERALTGREIECPAVDEYFGTILQYCVDTNWGRNREVSEPDLDGGSD